jgi:hypothetical protein
MSSSSNGKVTASVPGRITAPASSGGRSSASISAPYSFAAVAAAGPSGTPIESDIAGRCAKVFVAVQPSDPKTRVMGPTGALTGSLVPAAGKLVCGEGNSFRFSGSFGPLPTDGTGCGDHQVNRYYKPLPFSLFLFISKSFPKTKQNITVCLQFN